MPMQCTQKAVALPVTNPVIAKQRELEDQLSKKEQENISLVKQNLELQGQIADLREQLFNLQETSRHIERNASDAVEGQKLELSHFKVTVSNGLKEASIKRRQAAEKFTSDLNAALSSRMENLEDCDHLLVAAMGVLQEGEAGSNDKVQTPAEQPQEVPQARRSIFGGESSSTGNHTDHFTDGGRVATAKMVEDDQAASNASSPRAPDTASKKRSAAVESSAKAVSKKGGAAKKVKTAKQKSPCGEEETFGRPYPCVNSLLAKDDATYQQVIGQLGPKNSPPLDESSRERLTVSVGAKAMAGSGNVGKKAAAWISFMEKSLEGPRVLVNPRLTR